MLKRVDRVQIAVGTRDAAESAVAEIFGAEMISRDEVAPLGASRTTMQAGTSLVEILVPDGPGPVQEFVSRWGGGLFGAGFSVADLDQAAACLGENGIGFTRAADQLFVDRGASFGLNAVISVNRERTPLGAIKWIYEVTNVVGDWRAAANRYAQIFALDSSKFHPITSKDFGYTGTLTLFDAPARLDRIEIAQITDYNGAMGRFHKKRGDSLYMFFVETDDVEALAKRLDARGGRYAAWRRDEAGLAELFIHPSAVLGVLVGVSRTEQAWLWSGDPDRARLATERLAQRKQR